MRKPRTLQMANPAPRDLEAEVWRFSADGDFQKRSADEATVAGNVDHEKFICRAPAKGKRGGGDVGGL